MLAISTDDIRRRVGRDNPWWRTDASDPPEWSFPKRAYFNSFARLALNEKIRRAAVLLGPRRVGKTVLIKQLVQRAISDGWDPQSILYVSVDTPIYAGIPLEGFLPYLAEGSGRSLVIFDEIQYLKNWEVHLKDLVDSFPATKFVVSGSAAPALRLKSNESGAGRFTEFMLPPLTFQEFLRFIGREEELIAFDDGGGALAPRDIAALNAAFVDYLNFGGYPEAVLNAEIRANPEQFVKNDIVDKVLLKDLPALYGISDIQELNRLFSFLAYNAGNEANLEGISNESGLTKPTIKRYIEYLESAFLIIKVSQVDQSCRSMQRERNFKVYLNNPSMRAALFGPVEADQDALIGRLAESAIYSQWQHSRNFRNLRYARWRDGEVDVVYLSNARQKPLWAIEIKWSDRVASDPAPLKSLRALISANPALQQARITSKTHNALFSGDRVPIRCTPTALYCFIAGRNASQRSSQHFDQATEAAEDFATLASVDPDTAQGQP
jgi:uncharacterized protein